MNLSFKPFTTPVNQGGLPIAWETFEVDGTENLNHLSAPTLSKLYWLLHSLNIDYSFTINNHLYTEQFAVISQIEPINRIIQPAIFSLDQTTHEKHIELLFNLGETQHHTPFNNTYATTLKLQHSDSHNNFLLTLNLSHLPILDKYSFSFFSIPLVATLHSPHPHAFKGFINHVAITPIFYTQ